MFICCRRNALLQIGTPLKPSLLGSDVITLHLKLVGALISLLQKTKFAGDEGDHWGVARVSKWITQTVQRGKCWTRTANMYPLSREEERFEI